MKRKTEKEILAESFRELAGKKSVDKITVYLHRGVIEAAMAGEELPKAPKSCPAFRPEDDTQ